MCIRDRHDIAWRCGCGGAARRSTARRGAARAQARRGVSVSASALARWRTARWRAGALARWRAGALARWRAGARRPPYNTKKDPLSRAALFFFSIINKSQGGHVHVSEYIVYVMFRVQRGWFGGWFASVLCSLFSRMLYLFVFELPRKDTVIKC